VLAQELGQHFHDRPVILFRLPRDSFERVDAAQPHVELLVAELVDGPAEPVRELPLPVQLERPRVLGAACGR